MSWFWKQIVGFSQQANILVSQQEIEKLFEHFAKLSGLQQQDGVIDKKEFQQTLGLKDGLLASRLFSLFDVNNDGSINFHEFVMAFSILSPRATVDEKLKCKLFLPLIYLFYLQFPLRYMM